MKTLLTALFVILLACDVQAGCFKPETVEQTAQEHYNEHVTHIGRTSAGEFVRLYQNPETGTWTLTIVMSPEVECTLTDGEGWRQITQGSPA